MSQTMETPNGGPIRRERRAGLPFLTVLLALLAVCSGGMMALGLPNLLTGEGLWLFAKVALVTMAASLVAFTVSKFAIDRGAPLAVIGYPLAGIVSVASILFVGIGLFAATYPGLVYRDTAHLELQEHGAALSETVAARNASAGQAGRIGPVIAAIVADLDQKRTCEIQSSCVSGRGNGGYGTVARVIEEKLGKAQAIAAQVEAGRAARADAVRRLNTLIASYQETLGETAQDIDRRRGHLQAIDAEIRQLTNDLDEALPVALIAAYSEELSLGTVIAERLEATRRLNAILRGHGDALRAVLGSIEDQAASYPPFPGRTGVADTFAYIPHFLPIAAITAVVELVLPITLWTYTLLALAWRSYRQERPKPPVRGKIDPFGGLLTDDGDDSDVADQPLPRQRRRRTRPNSPRANGRWANGHRPRGRAPRGDTSGRDESHDPDGS